MFKYNKKKPQGATRHVPKSPNNSISTKEVLSRWFLVGFGVVVGLFIATSLYWWQPWQPAKQVTHNSAVDAPQASPTSKPESSSFGFYELLPKQEVITTPAPSTEATTPVAPQPKVEVPKVQTKADKATQTKEAALATKKAEAEKAQIFAKQKAALEKAKKEKEAEKANDTARYTLQAGSFKNQAEAERRRAAAALSGLPVKVQKVTVKQGEEWYRVVVGPLTGKENAKEAHQTLQSEGIDSLMMKQNK